MRLLVQIGVLSAALGSLVVWEGALSSAEVRERRANIRVGRLISSELAAAFKERVSAIQLEGANSWLYMGQPEGWRIAGYHGAPAISSQLDSLAQALRDAEGVIRTTDEGEFATYGIGQVGDGPTWRVTFHGRDWLRVSPDGRQEFVGDPVYQVELGNAQEGVEGCYARVLLPEPKEDQRGVWAVDQNPLGALSTPDPAIPPMLDPSVIPASWIGQGRRIERVQVQRADTTFELAMQMRELTEEQRQNREPSFHWTLSVGGQPVPFEGALTSTYLYFVYRLPFAQILDRSQVDLEALVRARSAVVRLVANQGDPIEVIVGPPMENDLRLVYCSLTGCVYVVREEACALFAPDPQSMMEGATENPWEDFLQPPQ